MRQILLVIAILASLALAGCSQPSAPQQTAPDADLPDSAYCDVDADCVCGGIDTETDSCFMGNVDYYNKYVDRSRDCPDFCTGIGGNLVMRCIESRCIQMYECLTDKDCASDEMCINNKCTGSPRPGGSGSGSAADCSADSDCRIGGCSGQVCEPKSREPRMTTCEYLPEYECYGKIDCGCVAGKCVWKEDDAFDDCIAEARG